MEEALDRDIAYFRSRAFAPSTQQSYRSFRKSYLRFCIDMGYCPVPVTTTHLCRYVVHLAQRLAPNSISKYLSVVRLMHLESNLPNPTENNWFLLTLIKGIKRDKGSAVSRKLPITPYVLQKILSTLNLSNIEDSVFWAICLTMFFGFFRKASVLPQIHSFDPQIHLTRQDFHLHGWGIAILVRHSKTIQLRERTLQVPLLKLPSSDICPVKALLRAFLLTSGSDSKGPAFTIPSLASTGTGGYTPFSPARFTSRLKSSVKSLGLDDSKYSGHSFRRGAATWAFSMGVPSDVIQLLGDWRSDAYKAYLDLGLSDKVTMLKTYFPNNLST